MYFKSREFCKKHPAEYCGWDDSYLTLTGHGPYIECHEHPQVSQVLPLTVELPEHFKETFIVLGDTELFFSTLWMQIRPLYIWEIQRGMNDFRRGVLDIWAYAFPRRLRHKDRADYFAVQPAWLRVLL